MTAAPSSTGTSRDQFNSDLPGRAGKRRFVDPRAVTLNLVKQQIFAVHQITNHQEATRNVLYLSRKDFNNFFGSRAHPFVEVASRVYKVAELNWLEDDYIGINSVQLDELNENIIRRQWGDAFQDALQVYRFDGIDEVSNCREVDFKVVLIETTADNATILAKDLKDQAKTTFKDMVLIKGQQFLLKSQFGLVTVEVKSMGVDGPSDIKGQVTQETSFNFENGTQNVTILEKVLAKEVSTLEFKLKYRPPLSDNATQISPQVVSLSEMGRIFRQAMAEKTLAIGHSYEATDSNGRSFQAKLTAAFHSSNIKKRKEGAQFGYQVQLATQFLFTRTEGEVLFTSEVKMPANQMELSVISYCDSKQQVKKSSENLPWIPVDELSKKLKEKKKTLAVGEKFPLYTDSGEFLIEVVSAFGDSYQFNTRNINDLWELKEETKLGWNILHTFSKKLVTKATPSPIAKLSIEVSQKASDSIVEALLLLEKEGKKLTVDQSELVALIKNASSSKFVSGQSVEVKLKNGIKLKAKAVNLNFVDALLNKEEPYATLGVITEQTEIEFVNSEKTDVSVTKKHLPFNQMDISKELEKRGVTGLHEQVKKIKDHILLSRGELRDYAKSLGHQQERGLLLYGPPGTGKTALARALANLLGGHGVNIKHLIATELISKWVGDSEKRIRELVGEAIIDQQKEKEKSPLHVIILDEADALLQVRGSDREPWMDKFVAQFLGILDGDKKEPKLENVLFILMTNRKERIDPAVLRQGRIGLHLEIGLPSAKARREILELHLKKIREQNVLADGIDFDKIVKEMKGWSGATIKGMVGRVVSNTLSRYAELSITLEEWMKHPARLITQNDFDKAIEQIQKEGKAEEGSTTYFTMYN